MSSALAERLTGGRYVDVNIRRDDAARYGLNIADVQSVVSSAVGGENIGETVEGLQRFPINLRYPREMRDSLEKLRVLPVLTGSGQRLVLSDVADIRVADGRRCCAARTRACRAGCMSISGIGICAPPCRTCSRPSKSK